MNHLNRSAELFELKYTYGLFAIIIKYCVVVTLLAVFPAMAADQPSKEQITKTIAQYITKNGPPTNISGWLGMAKNVRVDEVNIKAVGRIQKNGNQEYTPVKADVSGSFEPVSPIPMGRSEPIRKFKGEVEFAIYQDPYGKWQGQSLR